MQSILRVSFAVWISDLVQDKHKIHLLNQINLRPPSKGLSINKEEYNKDMVCRLK